MTALSKTKFMDELHMTPDEKIVWEGGAVRAGIAIELLQGFFGIMALVIFFGLIFNMEKITLKKNPEYKPADQSETVQAADNKDVKKQQARKNAVPEQILNKDVLYLLLAGGGLLLVTGSIVATVLKVRNYWFVVTSERVCIQSGVFSIQVVTIDLDKIVSVIIGHSFWDRLFGTHSIEVVHAGGKFVHPNGMGIFNPYRIQYVSNSTKLPSELLCHWLPRDNHKRVS